MREVYESNFVVFLCFSFRFTEDVFILKENAERDNAVCSLNTNVYRFGDFPHFKKDAETLTGHDKP